MGLPPSFHAHTVQLEALQAAGRYGPSYDPPVQIDDCWVEVARKITMSSTGEQIVEAAHVWLEPSAPYIAPGDRLTLPNGHQGVAITVTPFDSPGALQHVEVSLT
jgi:hypothetical protein